MPVVIVLCLTQFSSFLPLRLHLEGSGSDVVISRHLPLPVPDLRHILAVLIDVMLVLDELVLHHLLQIGPLGTQLRQPIDHVLHQMKPVQVVLYPHVEGRCNRALFLVAPDVQVAVGPAVGQPVDQPGVSMKAKDDVLVFREERIVIRVAQPMRMFAAVAASSDRRH